MMAVIKFIKDNKFISIGLLISVIVVVLYIITKHKPEWFAHAEDCFNLAFQLCIGFMASFIFFVMQVYIPSQKKLQVVNKCISSKIQGVVEQMLDVFFEIGKIYIPGLNRKELNEKDCLIIQQKINFKDMTEVINPSKIHMYGVGIKAHYSVKEWLIASVENIERDFNKLFKYYFLYIDSDLMIIFEKISNSYIHSLLVKTHLKKSIPLSINHLEKDIYFTPYLNLMNELIAQEKKYR